MPRSPRDDARKGRDLPAETATAGTAASEAVWNPGSFAFDPDTLLLLGQVYDTAWREFEAARSARLSKGARAKASAALTQHLMAAANAGERDPEKLKVLALRAMGVSSKPPETADAAMRSKRHASTGAASIAPRECEP